MRRRIDFWLNDTHADDKRVLKRIETLKKKRSFRRMALDGIMVMSALAKGDLTLLLKLHPWIVDKILTTYTPPSPPPTPPADNSEVNQRLDQLTQIVLQQGIGQGGMVNKPAMQSSGTAKLQKELSAPTFDDDEDTLVLKAVTGTSAFDNFFASMLKADEYADRKAAEKEALHEQSSDAKQAESGRTQRKHSSNNNRINL